MQGSDGLLIRESESLRQSLRSSGHNERGQITEMN